MVVNFYTGEKSDSPKKYKKNIKDLMVNDIKPIFTTTVSQ